MDKNIKTNKTAFVSGRFSKYAIVAVMSIIAVGASVMVIRNAGKLPEDDSAANIQPGTQNTAPSGVTSFELPDSQDKKLNTVNDIKLSSEKRLYCLKRSEKSVAVDFTAEFPVSDSCPDKIELWDSAAKIKIADLTAEDSSSAGARIFTGSISIEPNCNAEEFDRCYYSTDRRTFMAVYSSDNVTHLSETELEVVFGFVPDNAEEPYEKYIPYNAYAETVEPEYDIKFWSEINSCITYETKGYKDFNMYARIENTDSERPDKIAVSETYGANREVIYLYDDGDMENHADEVKGDGVYSAKYREEFDFNKQDMNSVDDDEKFYIYRAAYTDSSSKEHISGEQGFTVYTLTTDMEKEGYFGLIEKIKAKKNTDAYKNADVNGKKQLILDMLYDIAENGMEGYSFSFLKKEDINAGNDYISIRIFDKLPLVIKIDSADGRLKYRDQQDN